MKTTPTQTRGECYKNSLVFTTTTNFFFFPKEKNRSFFQEWQLSGAECECLNSAT